MHTHAHAHEEAASMCAHERAVKKKGRDGEGTEGGANGKKQSLKGGGPGGPRYARERKRPSAGEGQWRGRVHGRERETRAGPTGTTDGRGKGAEEQEGRLKRGEVEF